MSKRSLSETHPDLAAEADGWDPEKVTAGSNKKLDWKCKQGHRWTVSPNARTAGKYQTGCGICSGRKILPGYNDLATTHPHVAVEADGWDPSTVSAGSNRKLRWKCQKQHFYDAVVFERSHGTGCPFCSGRSVLKGFNDLLTTHPDIANQAHGWDPQLYSAGSNKKMMWVCEFGHNWESTILNRVFAASGCGVCDGKKVSVGHNDLRTINSDLAKQANGWNPETVTAGSGKRLEWKCSLGHVWKASVARRSQGLGCPVCSGYVVLVGFNDLKSINPSLASEAYNWNPETVTVSSSKQREWICPKSHVWKAVVAARSQGSGCPYCSGNKVLVGFNDLASLNPLLANEADGWDPATVTTGSSRKLSWICSAGHKWKATVNDRSVGYGCPSCAESGYDPNKPGWLYFMQHEDIGYLQIGISNTPESRLKVHSKSGWELIELRGPMDGHLCKDWETGILRMLRAKGAKMGPRKDKLASHDFGKQNLQVGTEMWQEKTFPVSTIRELMRLTEEIEEGKK